MRVRKALIVGALIFLGAPLLAALVATAGFYGLFYFPNRTASSIARRPPRHALTLANLR